MIKQFSIKNEHVLQKTYLHKKKETEREQPQQPQQNETENITANNYDKRKTFSKTSRKEGISSSTKHPMFLVQRLPCKKRTEKQFC